MANTTQVTAAGTKGYKTSEFWATVVTGLLTWLNASGILGSFSVPVESLENIITLVIAYVIGRPALKGATMLAAKKD